MEAPRMTRARAAKATSGPSTSSATGLTAAARARAASTAATKAKIAAAAASTTASRAAAAPTSNKRKTRADDTDNEDNGRATKSRGRMKKGTATEELGPETKKPKAASSTVTLATRGRPRKTAEPAKQEPAKVARAKATGRKPTTTAAGPKKTTARGRAMSTTTGNSGATAPTAATAAAPAPAPVEEENVDEAPARSKNGTKKTVTFLSPEKENVDPVVPAKGGKGLASSSAMRGRPVRKPVGATTATKAAATRGRPKGSTNARKNGAASPLSPKMITQMPVASVDTSDDELAVPEKKPLRGILKTPAKRRPSTSPAKKVDVEKPVDEADEEDEAEAEAEVEAQLEAQLEAEHRLSSDSDGDDEDEGSDHEADDEDDNPAPALLASPAKRIGPSPYKDAMKSPAKRGFHLPSLNEGGERINSPIKAISFMQSPAKRPSSPLKIPQRHDEPETPSLPKSSLFSSPAKRPGSAMRPRATPVNYSSDDDRMFGQYEQAKSKASLFPNTIPLQDIEHDLMEDDSMMMLLDSDPVSEAENHVEDEQSPTAFKIPRKLRDKHQESPFRKRESKIMFEEHEEDDGMSQVKEDEEDDMSLVKDDVDDKKVEEPVADAMAVDDEHVSEEASAEDGAEDSTTPPKTAKSLRGSSPPKAAKESAASESDSEQYLADPIYARLLGTPSPFKGTKTPKDKKDDAQATRNKLNAPKIGFTPLAKQLNAWAGSPHKPEKDEVREAAEALEREQVDAQQKEQVDAQLEEEVAASPAPAAETPTRHQFFESTIAARMAASPSLNLQMLAAIEADIAAKYDQTFPFDDVMVTDEDMDLVAEARELSMMDPAELDRLIEQHQQKHEDEMSESSQEYGDENQMPIDPALNGRRSSAGVPPITPQRTTHTRTVHTVSKVPLKPADDSTPTPQKKRSASASRPRRSRASMSPAKQAIHTNDDAAIEAAIQAVSPAKSEAGWTEAGTPMRNVDSTLLRGVIVHVDVRTSDGADASNIFVDLLSQMGATCVNEWDWNPAEMPANSKEVGITHVVFKDGAKQTMDKVRQSGGVVQCVGVSWVLDCERQNEWLQEAPYYIESVTRRRKSGGSSAPTTPRNRRDSSIWVRSSPEDGTLNYEEEGDSVHSDPWGNSILTPVPATPAPDAVARYAAELAMEDGEFDDDEYLEDADADEEDQQPMGVKTCPPKATYKAVAVADESKNQNMLMRLMAARRKSLQFAPKIGSPLARSWK